MNTRMVISLGVSALAIGGSMVGLPVSGTGVASASGHSEVATAKGAASNAAKASRALAKRDGVGAVDYAEAAVAMAPRVADYRVLLGQSYLQGGRFASARQAFADALTLSPENGKAALNFALAQVATGDWAGARKSLDEHTAIIPASDRGLAMALAGDHAGAVALLTQVARSPQGDAKVRQNLALSLALGGQWQAARVVAAADMSPADVDQRLEQWAAFAQPSTASDQVATLLGVRAAQDAGQPVALALNAPAEMAPPRNTVAEVASPIVTSAPVEQAAEIARVPMVAQATVTAAREIPGKASTARVTFAPRTEVVQTIPATLLRPSVSATKIALATVPARRSTKVVLQPASQRVPERAPAKGQFYVQLGAFDNAAVAKDAWGRATRRFAAFSGHAPSGMNFASKTGSFYRLSVGGFAHDDAVSVCRRYHARGGTCFVRAGAGDQTANWVRKTGVQFASR